MKILFDQGTPVPLRKAFSRHEVATAFECGWQTLGNGELLAAAEGAGFEVMITTDQNLRYQQNLADRQLSIVVLSTTDWRRIRRDAEGIVTAIEALSPGEYLELTIALP